MTRWSAARARICSAQKAVDDAQNDADRARRREELSALREAQAERAARLAKIREAQEKEARKVKLNKNCIDNPLGC